MPEPRPLGNNVTFTGTTGTASITGILNLGTISRTFTIARGNKAADMAITAAIGGGSTQSPVGINKAGAGILYLSGQNNFTGPINVTGGVLQVDGDANLGSSANIVTLNGGTLLSRGILTHTVQIAGSGGTADVESTDLTTMNATIGGSGGLFKIGTGTLVLAVVNNFSGGVNINNGTVQTGSDLYLGTAGGAVSFGGGTLAASAPLTTSRPIYLNTTGTINAANAVALNGAIGGTGTLVKTGASTLVLGGNNVFSGGLNINQGTVMVSTDNNLGLSGNATVLGGGTLADSAAVVDLHPLTVVTGGGSINASAGTFTVTAAPSFQGNLTLTGRHAGLQRRQRHPRWPRDRRR